MGAVSDPVRAGESAAAVLAGVPGIASAYLFGSLAEGRQHRESDADVGVLLDRRRYATRAARFDVRLRLTAPLQSALRRDVDVVILNDAPPQLARRILTRGRRIVMVDPDLDRTFLRTTLSRAADLEPFLRRARRTKLEALGRDLAR
jgi:predicted nucleotidyltransferase